LNYDDIKNDEEDLKIKTLDTGNNQNSNKKNKREIINWNFSCLDNLRNNDNDNEDCNCDSDEFKDDVLINNTYLGSTQEVVSNDLNDLNSKHKYYDNSNSSYIGIENTSIKDTSQISNNINNLINNKQDLNNNSSEINFINSNKRNSQQILPPDKLKDRFNINKNDSITTYPVYNKINNLTVINGNVDERGIMNSEIKMNKEIQETLKKINRNATNYMEKNGGKKNDNISSNTTNKKRAQKMENIKKCFDGE